MVVRGRVLGTDGRQPAPGVVVFAYQTDADPLATPAYRSRFAQAGEQGLYGAVGSDGGVQKSRLHAPPPVQRRLLTAV